MCLCAKLLQLCLILCDRMGCRLPGSSVHGILQARIVEWVAISFSRGSSPPRDWTHVSFVSCIGRQILYHWRGTFLCPVVCCVWPSSWTVSGDAGLLTMSPLDRGTRSALWVTCRTSSTYSASLSFLGTGWVLDWLAQTDQSLEGFQSTSES